LAETAERDIDVVFLGNISRRRRPLLKELELAMEKAGFKLRVVDRNCYGDERTQLLNRSKILLHLNSHPWELPGMRMLMAMSCKAMVVSEYAEDSSPYIDGKHLLMAHTKNLANLVVSCLKDEARRTEITDQAYQFVTGAHTLATSLAALLDSRSRSIAHKN
jgi:spore maturation protein CgeB